MGGVNPRVWTGRTSVFREETFFGSRFFRRRGRFFRATWVVLRRLDGEIESCRLCQASLTTL